MIKIKFNTDILDNKGTPYTTASMYDVLEIAHLLGPSESEILFIPKNSTTINDDTFAYDSDIRIVVIPSNVTTIGRRAFQECPNLSYVIFEPNSQLSSIDQHAFYSCTSLKSIELPSSVTTIGEEAFADCTSLSYIHIPGNVDEISTAAFQNCSSLKEVIIGNGVTTVGEEAFQRCEQLQKLVIGNNVTTIKDGAFADCTSLTEIEIPDNVEHIGENAFDGCTNLQTITIGKGIKSIGNNAFYNINSASADASASRINISNINTWCNISFGNSDANPLARLSNLYVNDNLIQSVTIQGASVSDYAFYNYSKLKQATINCNTIGEQAFYNCNNLTNASINTVDIRNGAFENCCNINTIKLDYSRLKYFGDNVFSNCTSLPLQDINGHAFLKAENNSNPIILISGNQDAAEPIIPETTEFIHSGAFSNNQSLTTLSLPAGLRSIGAYAFYNCPQLETIDVGLNEDQVGVAELNRIGKDAFASSSFRENENNWFSYTYADENGMVLAYHYSLYLPKTHWLIEVISDTSQNEADNGTNKYTMPYNNKYVYAASCGIADGVFESKDFTEIVLAGCCDMQERLHESITGNICEDCGATTHAWCNYIGEKAFASCSKLTMVHVPNTVQSIGTDIFGNIAATPTIKYYGTQLDWDNMERNLTTSAYNLEFI